VAKQVLVSMFTYHGTIRKDKKNMGPSTRASRHPQTVLHLSLHVRGRQPAGSRGRSALVSSRAISTRTLQQGGIALVDIPAQLTALQANINGRLLEPERVPWKAYFSSWLAMPLTAEQRIIAQQSSIICGSWAGDYPSPVSPFTVSRPRGVS
jgi:hypothetical protein